MIQNIDQDFDALGSTIISVNFGTVQTRWNCLFFFSHKLFSLMSSIVAPTNLTFQWGLHMASSKEHQNVGILTFVLFSLPAACVLHASMIMLLCGHGSHDSHYSEQWVADSHRVQTHTRVEMGRRDCLVRSNTFSTFYIPSKVSIPYAGMTNIWLCPSYRPWVSMRWWRCAEHQPRYQAEMGWLTMWVVHVLHLYLSGSLCQNTSGQERIILGGRSYLMMTGENN